MAKEWGFEEGADEDENGLNPRRKMIKANPFAGAVKKYRDNLGNMLEQTGGGDGAALPFLPESGRRDDNRGIQKPQSSPVPDPLVSPDVFLPKKQEQDNGQDDRQEGGQESALTYRIRLPGGPVGDIDPGMLLQKERTGNERMARMPGFLSRDDKMMIGPKALNGNHAGRIGGFNKQPENTHQDGNAARTSGQGNEEGQPAGAAIGAESANLPDLSLFFGNREALPEKQDGIAPQKSGKPSGNANTAIRWEDADPVYWLVARESDNHVARNEKILQPFFRQSSDMAKGLAGVRDARFNPEGLSWYGKEERELMQALMNAHIGVTNSQFDPDMARKQAYPFLNRLYDASSARMGGDFSGIRQGSFSLDTLNEQAKTHLYNGTLPDLRLSQTVANAMNSLDKTPYGIFTKNFMASVHRGMINLSENSIQSALTVMSSAPPPEIAMFHYQQMLVAHGSDTAGLARELENMTGFKGHLQEGISSTANRVKDMYGEMRSADYNQLEWLTLDPNRAAWQRPDKMTGDLFEKLVPAILGMKGVSKAAEGMDLARKGEMFIKGTYAVNTGYTNAYMAAKRDMITHVDKIDRDPDYIRYRQESHVQEDRAKEIFIEAKARQSGVEAGLLTLATFTGTTLFRQATDTGTDSAVISLFKQIVGTQTSSMSKEAFYGARKGIDQFKGEGKK